MNLEVFEKEDPSSKFSKESFIEKKLYRRI